MRLSDLVRGRGRGDLAFDLLWLLLGIAALVAGWLGWLSTPETLEGPRTSYLIVTAFGFLALVTVATDAVRVRAFRFVGSVAGILLGLYGLALVILGHEDVGGPLVALPFGLSAIGLGGWTAWRALRGGSERGDVA